MKIEQITDDIIEKIASKYKIKLSVIKGLLLELAHYENDLHDSFEAFKKLPFPKRDNLPWSTDSEGWVKLSLCYHKYQQEFIKLNPKVFKRGIIKSKNGRESLELSEFIVNDMLKVYFEKLTKDNLLLNNETSEKLRNFYNRKGRRAKDENTKRDNMIRIAASYLNRHGIKRYTALIIEVFKLLGYNELKKGNLRYIRKPS